MRFFEYPLGDDTREHAARGVGPASDYATPIGTLVDAPFAGTLTRRDTREGGYGLTLTGERYIFVAQHLREPVNPGKVAWRQGIARSGNTGTDTDGPHVHAWIMIRATGRRISFSEWLRDYVHGAGNAPASAAPAGDSLVGREVVLPAAPNHWFWYRTDTDAANMRNARGGHKGGGIMLTGPYTIRRVGAGGSLLVRSNANGDVWLHSSAINHLR